MAQTGNRGSITFAQSGFVGSYEEIGGLAESVPVLSDSDLATTVREKYLPGDLASLAGIACRIFWDPDNRPPLNVVQTITITTPPKSNQTNGGTLAGTGFISERTGPSMANNRLMMGEFTLQFDGRTGPVYTNGS